MSALVTTVGDAFLAADSYAIDAADQPTDCNAFMSALVSPI